jgi:hypothetical protein
MAIISRKINFVYIFVLNLIILKMKKIYSLLLMFAGTVSFAQTFYSENFGTPTGTTLFPAYTTGTAPATFQNSSPILYSGSGDVRTSTASTGYAGVSGSGNVFLTSTAGKFLQIDGLNSSAYLSADLQLSFGHLTNNIALAQLVVEVSTNGTVWTPLTFTQNPTSNVWALVTIGTGQIPSSATLSLRFTQSATAQMRIDDIKLSSVSASCTLALGTPTTACDAVTSALDTYTVTIPYTGGANATYTITPSSGTVGGDNPTTVAAGNITISGITEGTVYSVTVTGGTCNVSTNGNSPECKVTNTLPVNEPFNYTVGTTLNNSQMWSNVSVGSDEITSTTGNLNYTGITSSGNSISFAGTGSDTKLPFTDTTSGDLYASFLVSVTNLTGVSTTGTTYFAALSNAANSFTVARIYFKTDGTQFQYGISPTTLAADIVWSPNTYAVSSTQYLVLRYDFTNNVLFLYENPTIGGPASSTISVTPTAALTSIANLVLRQDTNTTTPAMTIDELTIRTTPNFTLSSASFSQIDGLKMYPNPTKNNLYIETALNSNINVSIVNMLGKEVVKANVVNNTVNVSNLTSGIYIVKITEEGKTSTKKLIIE